MQKLVNWVMQQKEHYDFASIEAKWQKKWEEEGFFAFSNVDAKKKCYVLEMLPYPSGNLHMGHIRNYSAGDAIARLKRAQGFDVLYTTGWDAFGLPAENAAIENNQHPADWTVQNIAKMKSQLKKAGFSYEWKRETTTCLPEYYKHEQLMFIKFFEHGIAYQKDSIVNWDPVDKTVLANEQVVDGKGWRSGAEIEKKKLKQWFLRTSAYAEKLHHGIDTLHEWPNKIRQMQKNWIGRSEGAMVSFAVVNPIGSIDQIDVFTTRPDTLFGAAFIAVSIHHPLAFCLAEKNKEIQHFIKTHEIANDVQEKIGIQTGIFVEHVFNNLKLGNGELTKLPPLPVYIANFVASDYGSGAVFGCPAHDERDFELAKKHGLEAVQVVEPKEQTVSLPYVGDGVMANSYFLDGLENKNAKVVAVNKLEEIKKGHSQITYKLRDWGVSRQRYWGCPIPIVYCQDCGVVSEKLENLPIELPRDVVFDGKGNPLENHPTWKRCSCPKCNRLAIRETDTLDTFFESSWYFLRYICPTSEKEPFDKKIISSIMPVDEYIGGIEHAILHLLYARFFMYALNDVGLVDIEEPFKRLTTQGMVCHRAFQNKKLKWVSPEDVQSGKDGKHHVNGEEVLDMGMTKMSKSKKNVVSPDRVINEYGADAMRLFILSDTPFEYDMEWSSVKLKAANKYLKKIFGLAEKIISLSADDKNIIDTEDKDLLDLVYKTSIDFKEYMESFKFNKAIALIYTLSNKIFALAQKDVIPKHLPYVFKEMMLLLLPITPHLASEVLDMFRNNPVAEGFQKMDSVLEKKEISIGVQVNGKLRGEITLLSNSSEEVYKSMALENKKVKIFLRDAEVTRIIVVPNKIVNILTRNKQ